jgi:PPOX class probable F420-dependent enzyme
VEPAEARERLARARVARLATADAAGRPHVVPICFAVAPRRVASQGPSSPLDIVYHAIDHKPKSGRALRRLANVAVNPSVALIADHYEDEDWAALWWVRADGRARVLEGGTVEAQEALALLVARYAQYEERPPAGPVVAVDVERWSGWRGIAGG